MLTITHRSARSIRTTVRTIGSAKELGPIRQRSYVSLSGAEKAKQLQDKASASLDSITRQNARINAFVDLSPEDIIRNKVHEATDRWVNDNPKSPLDGVLMGFKMNLCTSDLRTTCGSKMLDYYSSPFDATAVRLLKEAGVIMAGKTNMDEFGMGSYNIHSHTGITFNPFGGGAKDKEQRVAGGSSGGSAAAVASDMCFAALGSDTGGSVRLPASYCGIVGFKPSYGSISRWGLVSYASSLDTVGILAKNVEDAKMVYEIIAKEDEKDATCQSTELRTRIRQSIPATDATTTTTDKPLNGLRIGIPQEYNVAELSPSTVLLWRRGIQTLKDAGATVIPVSLPSTKVALGAYYTIATAEASSNLQRYDGVRYGHQSSNPETSPETLYAHTRTEGFGEEVRRRIILGTFVLSSGLYDNYFLQAQRIRHAVRQDFDRVFARSNAVTGSAVEAEEAMTRVHALLTPSAVTPAPKLKDCSGQGVDPINAYLNDVLTIPASLAGIPAMSVPFGLSSQNDQDHEGGLPVGLQVLAQYGDDQTVFRVAKVLETAAAASKPNIDQQ